MICIAGMIKKKHEHGLALACAAAKMSNVESAQHGCVVLGPRDVVLAAASNRRVKRREPGLFTEHAEEAALRRVRQKDRALIARMYVTRANGNGFSMPCGRCRMRIEQMPTCFPVYYT